MRDYLSKIESFTLININNIDVFDEANVGTLIYIGFKRMRDLKKIKIIEIKTDTDFYSFFQTKQDFISVNNEYFQKDQWCFQKNEILALKRKLEKGGKKLIELTDLKINRGITTGANDIFIISEGERNDFIKQDPKCQEVLVPVLKGADIKRWIVNAPKNYLIYSYTDIDIKKYKSILAYLTKHKEVLSEVYEARKKQKKWFELRACSYYDSFSKEKLIWTRLSPTNSFAISVNGEFSIDSTSFAIGDNLKYYCCLLNSKLLFFYFKLGSVIWGVDGIKWFGDYYDSIPIIPAENANTDLFNNHFNMLTKEWSFELEECLDLMVYKLYNLTFDECKIIDPGVENLISRKDYEKATIEELAEWEFKK